VIKFFVLFQHPDCVKSNNYSDSTHIEKPTTLHGIQEVVGSIPINSTSQFDPTADGNGLFVGAAKSLLSGFWLEAPHPLKKQQWNDGNQAFQQLARILPSLGPLLLTPFILSKSSKLCKPH
jgi:hypothetical protein